MSHVPFSERINNCDYPGGGATSGLIHAITEAQGAHVPQGVTQEDILALEQRIGMTIPSDLRQLLMLCNAPDVGPTGIFGISPTKSFQDIETVLNLYSDCGWKEQGGQVLNHL